MQIVESNPPRLISGHLNRIPFQLEIFDQFHNKIIPKQHSDLIADDREMKYEYFQDNGTYLILEISAIGDQN